jgi:hypothetical protein
MKKARQVAWKAGRQEETFEEGMKKAEKERRKNGRSIKGAKEGEKEP